jgi:hypothetical protein
LTIDSYEQVEILTEPTADHLRSAEALSEDKERAIRTSPYMVDFQSLPKSDIGSTKVTDNDVSCRRTICSVCADRTRGYRALLHRRVIGWTSDCIGISILL